MLRRILLAGLVAGLVGGIANSIVQEFTTTPLILHAEQFENAQAGNHSSHAHETGAPSAQDHAHNGGEAWSPANGIERDRKSVV